MPSRGPKRVDNKRLVIVVSGSPGSGKSTIARRLAGDLGLRYLSTGSIFRETARKLGISLVELSVMAESDPSIDLMIDKRTIEEARRGGVVIDSHLAAWLIHDIADYLVYTKAPLMVRARRVAERDKVSLGEALEEIVAREYSQWRRFKRYYGIDVRDLGIFDIIIDTYTYGREEAYRAAVEGLRLALGKDLI
ncbi:MAG: AAA family ATPase [Desulfurococcales archaeon]|nr:AAA family ATPase [Desulfurococcales archaeon]